MVHPPFPAPETLPTARPRPTVMLEVVRGGGLSMVIIGTAVTALSLVVFVVISLFIFVAILVGEQPRIFWEALASAGFGVLLIILGSCLACKQPGGRGDEEVGTARRGSTSALIMATVALMLSVMLAMAGLAIIF